MSEATPYDHDRAAYSREGLARLVLADHATEVADSAAGLVGTRNDVDTGLAGRVSQARQLIELAERTLNSAVVYEVERGSSWAQIAAYLGVSAEEARERYTPAVHAWNSAFEEPYRLNENGPQAHAAAADRGIRSQLGMHSAGPLGLPPACRDRRQTGRQRWPCHGRHCGRAPTG